MENPFGAGLTGVPHITEISGQSVLPSSHGQGLDILAVDSDGMSLACTKLLLERAGHRVTAAGSGEMALEHALVRPFDLALMELALPGLSGDQTARLFRDPLGGVLTPNLPIIALASRTGRRVRLLCRSAGMDGFLPKPILWEDLQHTINATLARCRRRQAT